MARFVRAPESFNKCGLSKSRGWQLIKEGQFPKPIRIGPNSVAWLESELDEWIAARVAERDQTSSSDQETSGNRGAHSGVSQ